MDMKKFFGLCLLFWAAHAVAADDAEQLPMVKMQTSMGDILIELEQAKAPKTVDNFLRYVKEGFYDGTIFHRVIDGFMIQGGGFTPEYKQKEPHPPIENEAKNGLKNVRGALAMARTSDPHSASAQFFINVKDNTFLDYPGQDGWGYAVFGRVVEGMEVVDQIKTVKTGSAGPFRQDAPREPVIIQNVSVVTPDNAASGDKAETPPKQADQTE